MTSHGVLSVLMIFLCLLSETLSKPATTEGKDVVKPKKKNDLVRGLPKEEAEQVDKIMLKIKRKIAKLDGFDIPDDLLQSPFIGDIAMTLEQASSLLEYVEEEEAALGMNEAESGVGQRRQKRNSLDFEKFAYTQWDLPIEFSIRMDHFETEEVEKIRKAFKVWEDVTCVRFKEVNENKPPSKGQRLEVKGDERGCWSYIGRTKLDVQPINLQPAGCTLLVGIMAHEVGHAIGLYHTEDRPDRDDYIKVIFKNMLSQYKTELEKQPESSVNYYGVPYDHASLMQLRRDSYSKDGSYTLLPKDHNFLYTMGMLAEISFLDATIVNRGYKCYDNKKECPKGGGDLHCYENGYPDPGLGKCCSTCRCPGGLGGDCSQPFENAPGCVPMSSELHIAGEGFLESPRYNTGGPYNVGESCSWILNAPEDYVISFQFWKPKTDFGVYHYNASGGICTHWVEINYHGNFTMPAKRHCGSEKFIYNQKETVLSTSNRVLVYFSAESDELLDQDPALRRGFRLLYDIKKNCSNTKKGGKGKSQGK